MWIGKIKKMKGVYAVLNLFDSDSSKLTLMCECWVPTKYMQDLRSALDRGTVSSSCYLFQFIPASAVLLDLTCDFIGGTIMHNARSNADESLHEFSKSKVHFLNLLKFWNWLRTVVIAA